MYKHGDNYIHEQNTFRKLENFGRMFWVSKLKAFSEYEDIDRPFEKRSNIGIKVLNAINLLFLVKFAMPLFTSNKFITRTVFADIGWLMVYDPRPGITLCHICCILAVLVINFYWQHSETNNSNGMIRIFNLP